MRAASNLGVFLSWFWSVLSCEGDNTLQALVETASACTKAQRAQAKVKIPSKNSQRNVSVQINLTNENASLVKINHFARGISFLMALYFLLMFFG